MDVLYTGVTNNLPARISEHYLNRGNPSTFAGKYYCYNFLYFKSFGYDAIVFEKRIKGRSRKKKETLILDRNPTKRFLNEDIMEWPPSLEMIPRPEYKN